MLPLATEHERTSQRLDTSRAVGAVIAAFLLAQISGKVVAETFASSAALRGGAAAGGGPLPQVVIPAMLASELALLLVSLIVPLSAAMPLRQTLGVRRAPWHVLLAAAFGTVMLGPIGDALMSLLTRHFPGIGFGVVTTLREAAQTFPLWLTWPAFALMPGVAEELLFRGVLQRSIRAPLVAVLVSGIAFAAFHVDPVHVAGVLPLGLFLAWVGQRAGTGATMFAHVVNNSLALLTIKTATLDVGFGTGQALPTEWLVASAAGALLAVRIIARGTKPAA